MITTKEKGPQPTDALPPEPKIEVALADPRSAEPVVLLVEDDSISREILAELLREDGPYSVVAASSGRTALDYLARGEPLDAVVSDIRMPGTSGMDLLRELRRTRPDVPVILVTGHASLDTACQAVRDDAFAYVQKPLDYQELLELVAEAVEEAARRRRQDRLPARMLELVKELENELAAKGQALEEARFLVDLLESSRKNSPGAHVLQEVLHDIGPSAHDPVAPLLEELERARALIGDGSPELESHLERLSLFLQEGSQVVQTLLSLNEGSDRHCLRTVKELLDAAWSRRPHGALAPQLELRREAWSEAMPKVLVLEEQVVLALCHLIRFLARPLADQQALVLWASCDIEAPAMELRLTAPGTELPPLDGLAWLELRVCSSLLELNDASLRLATGPEGLTASVYWQGDAVARAPYE